MVVVFNRGHHQVLLLLALVEKGRLQSKEKKKFLEGFSEGSPQDKGNVCEIGDLGANASERVLRSWMKSANRTLTNYQVPQTPFRPR